MSKDIEAFIPAELQELPSGWRSCRLSEVADDRGITYGIVQPGRHDPGGTPIVRVNNIRNGRVSPDDVMRVSAEIARKYHRTKLRGGEVLITLVGTLGEVAVVPNELCGWNVARAVGVIPVVEEIGASWVALCLRSSPVQHFIKNWATTTVQATLNLKEVAQLPVILPPKHERDAIARVLGALDDKMELNRRLNRSLEELAQAVFRSWFVDFDPVTAKASGRPPVGLDPATADLFPDHFQDSELGEIPKGWRVERLGNIADVGWGDTSKTKASYVPNGFCAYSATGADGFLPYFDFDRRGVVVSAIGANAGASWLATGKWSCIKNTLRFWATSDDVSTEYLFHATKSLDFWPLRGSAQPFISQGDARSLFVIVPSNGLARCFTERVSPMFDQIAANDFASKSLAAARDALLPPLLSGELRVPQAERLVEGLV